MHRDRSAVLGLVGLSVGGDEVVQRGIGGEHEVDADELGIGRLAHRAMLAP